jgi:integrase
MPKLTRKPPKLIHHIPSGQARARYRGKDHYFGPYGSPESFRRYAEFLGQLVGGGPTTGLVRAETALAVKVPLVMAELIDKFDTHAVAYYRRDGKPTGEHITFRAALRPALILFGALPVTEFSPGRLVAVRDEMIRMKWSRRYINASVRRIRQMFRWAVAQELVPPAVAGALAAVEPLKEGRSEAREKDLPGTVDDVTVEATIPHVSPAAADLIRLMQFSGMRPAEAANMTVEAIDRSDPECWRYRPGRHKTYHRGKGRVAFLGPRCQEILLPYLVKAGPAGKVFPLKLSGLRSAIRRGAKRAGVAHWAPNQLRHSHATAVRKEFGVEGAQVMLGHAHINTTEIYAEANMERGKEVAKKLG